MSLIGIIASKSRGVKPVLLPAADLGGEHTTSLATFIFAENCAIHVEILPLFDI